MPQIQLGHPLTVSDFVFLAKSHLLTYSLLSEQVPWWQIWPTYLNQQHWTLHCRLGIQICGICSSQRAKVIPAVKQGYNNFIKYRWFFEFPKLPGDWEKIATSFEHSIGASGGKAPDQELCPWTLLGAPPQTSVNGSL